LLPHQLELNSIFPYAAHPQNIVQQMLNNNLAKAPMLEWRGIRAKDLC
jgi:hypothetical protein